jgi:hypothetical protein
MFIIQLVFLESERKGTLSGDSAMMYALDVSSHQEDDDDDGESVQSNKNSMSTLSALGDDDLDDLDDAELESSRLGCQPLFVHLACSVRAKNCPLRSMPIRNIPVCFSKYNNIHSIESHFFIRLKVVLYRNICIFA